MKHNSSRQIFEKYSDVINIGLAVAALFHEQRRTRQTAIFVITAVRIRPLITDGGKETKAIMWRAAAGIPSSVRGRAGNSPNVTAMLRRILRLTSIRCSVFWHYWWMKFRSSSRSVSWACGSTTTEEVAERIRK